MVLSGAAEWWCSEIPKILTRWNTGPFSTKQWWSRCRMNGHISKTVWSPSINGHCGSDEPRGTRAPKCPYCYRVSLVFDYVITCGRCTNSAHSAGDWLNFHIALYCAALNALRGVKIVNIIYILSGRLTFRPRGTPSSRWRLFQKSETIGPDRTGLTSRMTLLCLDRRQGPVKL